MPSDPVDVKALAETVRRAIATAADAAPLEALDHPRWEIDGHAVWGAAHAAHDAFIAACSPAVVLALLAEVDRRGEALRSLLAAVDTENFNRQMASLCREAAPYNEGCDERQASEGRNAEPSARRADPGATQGHRDGSADAQAGDGRPSEGRSRQEDDESDLGEDWPEAVDDLGSCPKESLEDIEGVLSFAFAEDESEVHDRSDVWISAEAFLLKVGLGEVLRHHDADALTRQHGSPVDLRRSDLCLHDDQQTVFVGVRQTTKQIEQVTSLAFGLVRLEFPYAPSEIARKFSDLVACAVEITSRRAERELGHVPRFPALAVEDEPVDEVVEGRADALDRFTDDDGEGWVSFDLQVPRGLLDLGVVGHLGGGAV